jgi:Spy/CpxP family protein refolding chaperone
VIGAVIVRRDGLVRPVLVLAILGALTVILGALTLVTLATAAHGQALLAGGLVAGLVTIGRRHHRLRA